MPKIIMENKTELLKLVIIITLCFICKTFGDIYISETNKTSICYDEPQLNSVITKEKELEYIDITMWGIYNDIELLNKAMARSENADLIYYKGSIKDIKKCNIIEGVIHSNAKNQCVISKKLAFSLFNTSNCIGKSITYKDSEYLVSGVIESEEKVIFISNEAIAGEYYRFEIKSAKDNEGADVIVRHFINDNSLDEPIATVDGGVYYTLILFFSRLPILISIIVYIIKIYRKIGTISQHEKKSILKIFLNIFSYAAIIIWFVFSVKLPNNFIPTKWSDFSFWKGKYDILIENALNLKRQEFMYGYEMYSKDLKTILFVMLIAVVIILLLNFGGKLENNDKWKITNIKKAYERKEN